jgi:hypothetical protein
MPKVKYQDIKFRQDTLNLIQLINSIVTEYNAQGFDLTLRQVYYQLVARGYIPNNEKSYKRVGNIINDGRLAGLIDWNAITDRTRNLRNLSHWSEPRSIISTASSSYQVDHWAGQPHYVEVWVEKDALVGVVGSVCNRLDVPYFSCRGYVSQSEMWIAAQRFKEHEKRLGQFTHVVHLGDHDPSGIDMSRDIQDRLNLFGSNAELHRIALTMKQIEQFNPPPNPTKLTDARASGYLSEYGEECWELDALDPKTIRSLIQNKVTEYLDTTIQKPVLAKERKGKGELELLHKYFYNAVEFLEYSHAEEASLYSHEEENSFYDYEEEEDEDEED